MSAEWSKIPQRNFKASFWYEMRMKEIWRHKYRNENTSNGPFHFSENYIEYEFQPIDFLTYDALAHFDQKSSQTFISTPLFSAIWWFYQKKKRCHLIFLL